MGNVEPRRENQPVLRLGELALKAGFISPAQLQRALAQQKEEAKSGRLPRQLGLILLSLGFLDEADLLKLLSEQEKQRSLLGRMEAPSPPTGPKPSVPTLKKLPTLVPRPDPGSGRPPAPPPSKLRARGS